MQAAYPDITIYKADIYIGEKTLLKTYKANGFTKKSIDALSDPDVARQKFRWARREIRFLGPDSSDHESARVYRQFVLHGDRQPVEGEALRARA